MKKRYRVVIPRDAKASLRDIVEYLKKQSSAAAAKVRKRLLEKANSLSDFPERFSKEEYSSEKSEHYRSV